MTHPADSRKTIRLLSVLVFLSIVPPFIKYAGWETRHYVGGDFEIFLQATRDLSEGKSPYPPVVLESEPGEALGEAWGNYIYPPLFARLLTPFSCFPPIWAKRAYLLVCLVIYLWLFRPRAWDRMVDCYGSWLIYALILGWGPVIQTFRQGQSDFIPLFLILLSIRILEQPNHRYLSRQGQEILAGCLLGIASMVKITPVLIFPALVAARQWKCALGFVFGVLGALILPGPIISWQYFTQVLPNMTDFAGMRICPSIHIVLVRLVDSIAVPPSWQENWPRIAEGIGVAGSGVLFLAVLIYLARKHDQIRLDQLLILACFFPPLFAGEVAHHYALALIPVVVACHRLLVDATTGHSMTARRSRNRLILLITAILPNFYYWIVIMYPFSKILPSELSVWLVVGNLLAFVLAAPVFAGSQAGQSTPQKGP